MGAPPLPALESVLGQAKIGDLLSGGLTGVVNFEPLRGWLQDLLERIVPGVTAGYTAFQLNSRADFMIRLVTALLQAEERVAPKLLQLAALGLEDYFGVHVDPNSLGIRGGTPGRQAGVRPLSDAMLEGLFGALGSARNVDPAAGYDNMLRLFERQLLTAVEGWLEANLGLGVITKDLPDWGSLDDIVARTMGLGRLTSRAIRPLLDALIVEPSTQQLRKTYRNALPSESLAARMFHRKVISQDDYFEIMARHGWDRTAAAEQLLSNALLPSRADLRAMLELELISPADMRQTLTAQGYPDSVAGQLVTVIREDRTRELKGALATLARDMYRDREASAQETEALLTRAGYSDDERALLLAVADIERSRPKRPTASTMENMYRRDLVELVELRAFYVLEGYAPADVDRLEALAVQEKLEAVARAAARPPRPPAESPGALPRSVALEAHRRGIMSDAQLRAVLEAQGVKGPALETLVQVAAARRHDYLEALAKHVPPTHGLTTSAGTVEEAYVRGLVGDVQLRALYTERGFAGAQLEVLLALRLQERLEWQERQAAAAARAAAAAEKDRAL